MGCCVQHVSDRDSTTEDDDAMLLKKGDQYEFTPEFSFIDCDVKNVEDISRRPSVLISISTISQLNKLRNRHHKMQNNDNNNSDNDNKMDNMDFDNDKKQDFNNNNNDNIFIKKYLKDDEWNSLLFRREASILKKLKTSSNINIITYISSYQDMKAYYLCIEYCCGGSLISHIFNKYNNNNLYNEAVIFNIISILISILDHIHSLNIVHRNICLENIYLNSSGTYKLIGWDDAEIIETNKVYNDFVGNLYYLSPECIKLRHSWELKKIDIFAVGVVCFILSFGHVPFTVDNTHNNSNSKDNDNYNHSLYKKIIKGQISYPKHYRKYVSYNCKQFMDSCLSHYTFARTSASDALLSSFLTRSQTLYDHDIDPDDDTLLDNDLIASIPFKLHCYETAVKIKQLLNKHNIWTKFEQNSLISIIEDIFDLNKDELHFDDLKLLLMKFNINENDAINYSNELFKIMDPHRNGNILISSFNNHDNDNDNVYEKHKLSAKQRVDSTSSIDLIKNNDNNYKKTKKKKKKKIKKLKNKNIKNSLGYSQMTQQLNTYVDQKDNSSDEEESESISELR